MGLILSKTGAEKTPAPAPGPGKFSKFLNFAFPALNLYSMGQEYADGQSVGSILGEQAGFIAGNHLVSGALSRFKFPLSGLVSTLGGMGAGMLISPIMGRIADKIAPIYRNKPKTTASINNQSMQMQMPPQMAN